MDEKHPVQPVDVNGINKLAGEWYHLLYNNVYGIRVRAAPHQHLRSAHARQGRAADLPRHLDPQRHPGQADPGVRRRHSSERDFNYVDDAVDALLSAAPARQADGQVFNLGADEVISLKALARSSCRCTAPATSHRAVPAGAQGDRHRRLLLRLREDPRGARLDAGCAWTRA